MILRMLLDSDIRSNSSRAIEFIKIGEKHKKAVTGLHHGHKFPELFITETSPDSLGVYKIQWSRHGLEKKYSTCVPKEWNMVQHAQAIMEAYNAPCAQSRIIQPGVVRMQGTSNSGIVFEIIAEITPDLSSVNIKSAYPMYNHPSYGK